MPGKLSAAISAASNVRRGVNPPYAAEDFLSVYPHFAGRVPDGVMRMYIGFADACVRQDRYFEAWQMAMSLFIAHFLHLYMLGSAEPGSDEAGVLAAGQLRGLATSKSAGGVSVAYDYSTAVRDLDGWAAWKLTNYGVQLATLAKAAGLGGMYVR